MRRLRDSLERMEHEDSVIDVFVAVESLFMEDGQQKQQYKRISRSASWHFADSRQVRVQARSLLKELYRCRSHIVHGKASDHPSSEERQQRGKLLADVTNVLRASIKSMIRERRPGNWEASKDAKTIQPDPSRPEAEIPSVESDSLSRTVAEQREVDAALEAVWKQTVAVAPGAGARCG